MPTKKIKPHIIILPGWCMPARAYEPLADSLRKQNLSVTVLDLPGFGIDPPIHTWGLKEYVGFVRKYIKKHHLSKVIFFGHSFGGRVALRYSFYYPREVQTLVLSGTPGFSSIPPAKRALAQGLAKFGSFVIEHLPIAEYRQSVQRMFYFAFRVRDFVKAKGVMRNIFKAVIAEPLDEYMKAVNCPCLLVWGADDAMVPVKIAKQMEKTIHGARLVLVPDARHGVPFKKATEVAKIIDTFLDGVN